MRLETADGRAFEVIVDSFVFTKVPLVVLEALTEYRIDGEPVAEATFRGELELANGVMKED